MKEKSKNSIGKLSTEERLQNAINELALQNEVMNKRAQELIRANKLRLFESNEKAARADELIIANKELAFQNGEKEKRAAELIIASKELAFQNKEKEKRAAELIIANKELAFQNKEKEKRADELVIANKELAFQNEEKEKRADELVIANKELKKIIAERKKAEEKLKDNYALLHIAGEIAKLGGWNVNLDENRAYWSDEVSAIHEMPAGYSPSVEEGINFYAPEWRDKITKVFTNCVQKGISYDEDMEIITSSGKQIWVRTNGEAVRDNNGKIVKVQGAFQDITERKKSEAAVIESKKEVRTLAESMPQIVWVTTAEGKNIYFNQQWVEYTGLSLEESYGDGWITPFHEDDKPIAWEAWNNAVENSMEYTVECRLRKYDGNYRWYLIRGVPKINEKGEIFKWYGTCTDIEKIKQAEIEHAKIIDDLIERNQNQEQFTYIVSHNLRAPVANIKGLSNILGDESLSKDEARSVVKDLTFTVNKLDSVILDLNNILQLKRNTGETKERVVFAELVNGIEESLRSLVLKKNVKIVAQFDEVVEMITLKSYLYSIFYNLISNSIKYKRRDACLVLEIKSFRREDEIELIFKDNGRGIDLEEKGNQVFGLYKRFHQDIEGKGMGLFMVKTQVEALGGKISIKSEINKGTEFKIIFANEKKYDN